ncbi:transposase [Candidatus Poribacteria bacterium]|nr:transposase [Candidatus Poribacteria bacterium]
MKSRPGVDIILGAKLLMAIGTDRERFRNAHELGAFFGTAPYTQSSGQHKSVHFRFSVTKGCGRPSIKWPLPRSEPAPGQKPRMRKSAKKVKKGPTPCDVSPICG